MRNPRGYITLLERIKRKLAYRERAKAEPIRASSGPELDEDEFSTPPSSPEQKKRKVKKKKARKKVKKRTPPVEKIVSKQTKKKKKKKKTPAPLSPSGETTDLFDFTSEEWPFQSEQEIQESIESRLQELKLREREINIRIEREREELAKLEASREVQETRSSNIREQLRERGRHIREKRRIAASSSISISKKPDAYDLIDTLETKQIDTSVAGTSHLTSYLHQ